MPKMDGLGFLHAVRANPTTKKAAQRQLLFNRAYELARLNSNCRWAPSAKKSSN